MHCWDRLPASFVANVSQQLDAGPSDAGASGAGPSGGDQPEGSAGNRHVK